MQDETPQASPGEDRHARLLTLATAASVATALLLIGAKLAAYLHTGAVSLLASLVDSLMDALASLLNLLAVRWALKPADSEHRFGHGKAESLAALFQAAFIVASSAFLLNEAVHRLLAPEPIHEAGFGIAVMVFAIAVTAALVSFQLYVIRRTDSPAIRADSLHYRGDLLSNAATVLAIALAEWGIARADPLFALGIAAYLLVSARDIISRAFNELLDRELPETQRRAITDIALGHPGVRGMHDLRTRRSGRTLIVQLHLELDDELPLREAHAIADAVEDSIRARYPDSDIVIHEDPVGVVEEQRWKQGQ